jgi:LDH2 family malate/lactate/ureidoglycolate dehydrogenase
MPPRLPGARGHAVARESQAEGVVIIDNLRHALRTVADLIEKRAA